MKLAALVSISMTAGAFGHSLRQGVHDISDPDRSFLREIKSWGDSVAWDDAHNNASTERAMVQEELRFLPFAVSPSFSAMIGRQAGEVVAEAGAHAHEGRPILWLHIHKAGGTFMCQMAKLAGERIVQPQGNCNWEEHDMWRNSGHSDGGPSCAERKEYFEQGEYSWGQIERELFDTDQCPSYFKYGVMMREPMALMESMLNFQKDSEKIYVQSIKDALAGPHIGSDDSQYSEMWKFMDNFQVRLLARAFDVHAGGITTTHVTKAREALENIDFVYRLEDLPSKGAELIGKLGWSSALGSHIGQKVNPSTWAIRFSEEEAAMLKDLNKWDIALYNSLR